MKFIAALVVLTVVGIVSTAAQPKSTPFSNCALGPTQMALTDFSVSPSPICNGKEFCYTATGTLSTALVEGATFDLRIRFLNRLVYSDRADLCDALTAGGHSDCNIPAGPVTLKICRLMKPHFLHNITAQFQTFLVNGDGGTIYCQAQTNYGLANCP
ncbi:hypothetical protein BG015_006346 [Linnemannia schmuckeri]|uniref:Phosphatidylglycerol/phosphatidylinositol transfer protein n=1 Tax=Linnemannia schmuckeri TaxID=64567 RepID=A0A9P5UUX8_9FUNG|nr:hypothetical protein BG015_006346 [Linnemannia schmuckeri]